MNISLRRSSLFALFALAASLSLVVHAGDRGLGQIRFVGVIVAPTVPGQQFVGGASYTTAAAQLARVGTEPVRQVLARPSVALLSYFAGYADRGAMLVTAVYP